jgi:hypothetical protein
VKSRFWAVRDVAAAPAGEKPAEHRLDCRWYLAPEFRRHASVPGGEILSLEPELRGAAAPTRIGILAAGPSGWQQRVEPAAWSSVYGKKEPVLVVHGSGMVTLPAEIFTMIVPLGASPYDAGHIERLGDGAWCYHEGDRHHYFLWMFGEGPREVGGWVTDAAFAYCSIGEDEAPQAILYGGRSIAWHGVEVPHARL